MMLSCSNDSSDMNGLMEYYQLLSMNIENGYNSGYN
jgi:hypothetical protein